MTTQKIPIQKTATREFQTGQVLTIVSGHFIHDIYTAFVPPLLPLLIEKLSLSLTLAGTLPAFLSLPGLLNPFIGYLGDKVSLRYFVILAPAVTATLLSGLGLPPNYLSLAILLLTAGVSGAAFHAPIPPMIARISGDQVGKGMSLFMSAGELGRTIGPLIAVWAVSTWTLDGFFPVVVLGWAASALLYWRLHDISGRSDQRLSLRAILPTVRRFFVPLLIVVLLRGFMLVAVTLFLPTFMNMRGASLTQAAASLTILELGGVGGALLGGTLSDRVGRKPILYVAMTGSALLTLVFLNVQGWLLVPVLLAIGFTGKSTQPVMLAMVQEQFPNNRAVATGLFLMTVFVTHTLSSIVIGFIGDTFNLQTAYYASAAVALLAVLAVIWLPDAQAAESRA